MNKKRVILWFRNDLRLHDNEALQDALAAAQDVYPVYVFDERVLRGTTTYGIRRTGKFRVKFLIESVLALKEALIAKGSDLIIRIGRPEDIITDLAKDLKTSWIFCNRERTYEEVKVQDQLEQNLWAIGQEVRYSRGKMLYYTSDLPFPVTHTPDVFTLFRKEVEKIVEVRRPLAIPETLPSITSTIDPGPCPGFVEFGFDDNDIDSVDAMILSGGEKAGLQRLDQYIWENDDIRHYKESRDGLLGLAFSSKFSVYLAQGCLSPKKIYHEIKEYEDSKGKTDSTYQLFYELLWRDFFRLMGKKHGNAIFKKGGIKQEQRSNLTDGEALFRIWSEGRTGMPFVDASMAELNTTGYMSSRARQNVASFLINDLKINWQLGARYFESLLLDYDPCSNWGNWNYLAGVGNDPREGRHYNIVSQAKKYDPDGAFVKHWIPALANVPSEKVHQPYLLTPSEQTQYNCTLQKDYPDLCIKKEAYS